MPRSRNLRGVAPRSRYLKTAISCTALVHNAVICTAISKLRSANCDPDGGSVFAICVPSARKEERSLPEIDKNQKDSSHMHPNDAFGKGISIFRQGVHFWTHPLARKRKRMRKKQSNQPSGRSEVGGSEPTGKPVSCCSCVRARGRLSSGNRAQMVIVALPCSLFPWWTLPFSLPPSHSPPIQL